jgi:lipopolysaccharide export system permease protein
MTLLDRYLLQNFVKAWLALFVSLVSLYVVIDAFSHFEELLQASRYLQKTITETMAIYYSYQLVLIFDRLCPVILLLAATFTIAWLQRQNELVPLLSAGVSTKRVLKPLYIGCLGFLLLQVMNREVLMPQLARHLEHGADDPTGEKTKSITGGFDSNGLLLQGSKAIPKEKLVRNFSCTMPTPLTGNMFHIHAKEAKFLSAGTPLPDGSTQASSGWLLFSTTPDTVPSQGGGNYLMPLSTGQIFVRVEQLDFRRITRNKSWYQYASLWEILSEMETSGAQQLPALATQLHQRLAAPLVTLITMTLGIGIILRDTGKNFFVSTGICLGAAAGIFLLTMVGKYLGEREFISTALAGWLPILIFAPLAFTMRDAMQS